MAKKRKAPPAGRRSAKTSKPASRRRRPAAPRAAETAPRKTAKRVGPRKPAKKAAPRGAARPPARKAAASARPTELFAPVVGADRREIGHVLLETGKAGDARVKRMVYPPGFRWSVHMKPVVGTDLCMHAHVGFLVHGEIHIEYPDGCVIEHRAPQIVAIEPGHDGWVVGKEPVVMIEFDFERDTVSRLGMPTSHTHTPALGPSSVPS
jgi:hypothetical protein